MVSKDKKIIFFLLIIAAITFFKWLTFNVFSYGDWWYFYSESMQSLLHLNVWNSYSSLGFIDLALWRFPVINLPFGLFGNMGFGQEVAEKITIFWPTIILGNIGVYYFVKRITCSSLAGFIASIIFNYNPYYLGTTHVLIYSAGVWSLISLLFFIKELEIGMKYFAILSAISMFIASSYDLRIAYILLYILFFYYVYNILFLGIKTNKMHFMKIVMTGIFPILLFILMSLYWVLPLISANSLTDNVILQRQLFGSDFLSLKYSLTLYYPFWNGSKTIPFAIQSIPFFYWLVPITAFSGLYVNRKKRVILFFGFLTLLGILLAKQTGSPFIEFYKLLYAKLPGFNAFREATKFYFLIALGYSVLIGSYVSWLTSTKFKTLIHKYFAWSLIYFNIVIFLLIAIPINNGEIGSIYVKRSIPNDYLILKSYILKQSEYFRILWVPIIPRYGISTINHPAVSNIELKINWEQNHSISSKEILDLSSIKYIIVPIHDLKNDDDFYKDYGSRYRFIEMLNKVPYLNKINIGTKELAIYENKGYFSHICLTRKKIVNTKQLVCENVSYIFKNPTKYIFIFKSVLRPFLISFSEAYHPDWKLRAGEFSWFRVLTDKSYFLSDKYHSESDAKLNSFYIDPQAICKEYTCKRNADGSYDISLTLYFRPQSYMYLGLIMSGATLALCLIYLAYHIYLAHLAYLAHHTSRSARLRQLR